MCQIVVGVPDVNERYDILVKMAQNLTEVTSDVLHTAALATIGFVGGDLQALFNEACKSSYTQVKFL